MRRRVVVTGMGVVSPIGGSLSEFCDNLLGGVSGVGVISLFDPAALRTRIAGEVRETVPGGLRDRKISFALEAARRAMSDATACGTSPGGQDRGRQAALSLGIGLELFSMEDLATYRHPDFQLPDDLAARLTFLQTPSDLCLHLISWKYGLDRPPVTHTSACAAGTDALGSAFRLVASGRRRWMLAGGTDSMINPLGLGGFCKIGATSTANESPERASRPFDRGRDGFVLGEGAGMLVLETLPDARARGASIHAEVVGYGNSFDAFGISEPHPAGRGAHQAMAAALADAGRTADSIDAINAHGSATPKNDVMETLAIKQLLGDRAPRVPISATKSLIGHAIAAAGAIEAIAAILCMQAGQVHPTINLENPDPACDLDYVARQARRHEQRCVLSTSFGFGGQNAAIVLGDGRALDV